MLKKYYLIAVLALSGCANTAHHSPPLQSRFLEVESIATEENILNIAPTIYTQSLLNENLPLSQDELWTALLWQSLPSRHSYVESIKGAQGCLSVNGFTKNKKPASIHIAYVKQNAKWLINLIEMEYLSSQDAFSLNAKCPVDIMEN